VDLHSVAFAFRYDHFNAMACVLLARTKAEIPLCDVDRPQSWNCILPSDVTMIVKMEAG
jgi:hypothetical protein